LGGDDWIDRRRAKIESQGQHDDEPGRQAQEDAAITAVVADSSASAEADAVPPLDSEPDLPEAALSTEAEPEVQLEAEPTPTEAQPTAEVRITRQNTGSLGLGGDDWIDVRRAKNESRGQHAEEPLSESEPVLDLELGSVPEAELAAEAEPQPEPEPEAEPIAEDTEERKDTQVQMQEQEAFQRAKACVQTSDWAGFAEVTAQVESFRDVALQQIATHAADSRALATSSTELSPVEVYLNALSQRTELSAEESAALGQAQELRELQQLACDGVALEEHREAAVHSSQAKVTVVATDGSSTTDPGPAANVVETDSAATESTDTVAAGTAAVDADADPGGGADWTEVSNPDSDTSSDCSEPI
jgi:predicted nucleic acid-binding Zn ribbon protein